MVFLIAHIGGCVWWFIKVQVDNAAARAFLVDDGTVDTIGAIYVSAVYFMMATLCTVGYGDIAADGTAERVFSIFTMCMVRCPLFSPPHHQPPRWKVERGRVSCPYCVRLCWR